MKLKDLTIFDKDAPEIDSITDQRGDRWSVTLFNDDDVIEISEFAEKGSEARFHNIEYGQSFIVQANDEVTVDKWGSLVLEDEKNKFMLDFYPFSEPIKLVPQNK